MGPEPDHSMVKISIAEAINKIGHREMEYNGEQLTEKIWNYIWKAKKSLPFENQNVAWKDHVQECANKFYSSMWLTFGDRKWMDDVEFTHLVCVAVQSYFPPEVNGKVPAMEFAQVLIEVPEAANDYNRFHWHAQEIVKEHVDTKAKIKKVYQVIGDARDEVVKLGVMDPATFMRSWTQKTLSKLTGDGHPALTLPKEQALPMFDNFATTVGIPQAILKIVDEKPRPGGQDVIQAVNEAYEQYGPEPVQEWSTKASRAAAGKGGGTWQPQNWDGGFGGKGGGWDKGGGGKGNFGKGDMMSMMNNMMSMMKGGGKGGGGGKWGPY